MSIEKYEKFKASKNKIFYVAYDGNEPPLALELVEISDLKKIGGGYEGFSMLFQASKERGILVQRTWTIKYEQDEFMEMFLVPVAERDKHYQYESIVSFQSES